ncbi:hypothetical protein BaRGS_00005309 [Batillaria attramentaria]|uniref:Uncharacterized protein n=1 Tax=Batillaria attramentaria TaxID=370345 RepID=A0ABD0LWA9_9CAEN
MSNNSVVKSTLSYIAHLREITQNCVTSVYQHTSQRHAQENWFWFWNNRTNGVSGLKQHGVTAKRTVKSPCKKACIGRVSRHGNRKEQYKRPPRKSCIAGAAPRFWGLYNLKEKNK